MHRMLVRIFLLLLVFLPPGISAQEALVVERAHRQVILSGYTRAKTTVSLSTEVSGKIVEQFKTWFRQKRAKAKVFTNAT